MLRLRLFFALIAQRTILAQDDRAQDDRVSCILLGACATEDLDLQRAQVYANYVEWAGSDRTINLMYRWCSLRNYADWLRSLWSGLVAVQDIKGIAFRTQHDLHDYVELLRLRGICVRRDDDLLVVENA